MMPGILAATSSWGDAINTFLATPLGGVVTKVTSAMAVILVIFGVGHAVIKMHQQGVGKVVRRIIEVIILGVFLMTPTIWGTVAAFIATGVQDIVNYVAGLFN